MTLQIGEAVYFECRPAVVIDFDKIGHAKLEFSDGARSWVSAKDVDRGPPRGWKPEPIDALRILCNEIITSINSGAGVNTPGFTTINRLLRACDAVFAEPLGPPVATAPAEQPRTVEQLVHERLGVEFDEPVPKARLQVYHLRGNELLKRISDAIETRLETRP